MLKLIDEKSTQSVEMTELNYQVAMCHGGGGGEGEERGWQGRRRRGSADVLCTGPFDRQCWYMLFS